MQLEKFLATVFTLENFRKMSFKGKQHEHQLKLLLFLSVSLSLLLFLWVLHHSAALAGPKGPTIFMAA